MRGKAAGKSWFCCRMRITPAYAGKSEIVPCFENGIKDHPRLCGEKIDFAYKWKWLDGSPPPMRGKAYSCICPSTMSRITPAYAGKRYCLFVMFHPSKDHPRLCGEKKGLDAKNFFLKGSPPPMRGKVKNSNDISMSERITPAYAGKSSSLSLFFHAG